MRLLTSLGVYFCLAASAPASAGAQDTATIDLYRFILGVDVPESPALVTLGVAPTQVLRGSAPKPIAASVLGALQPGGDATAGVAIDIAPYFLAGGGVRSLRRARAMTLAGRLSRVFIKTLLSLGAVRDPADPASPRLAVALRSTIHDPHDPALNSSLPEQLAAERGDSSSRYAAAREAMRARSGDVQLSAGWGVGVQAKGGGLHRDSLVNPRHAVWVTGQYTLGERLDILATVQTRDAFRADARWWLGLGIERKTTAADFRAELTYDTRSHDLHPGVGLEVRALPQVGFVASLSSQSAPPQRHIELRTLLHWFYAADR